MGRAWPALLVLPALTFVLLVVVIPVGRFLALSVINADLHGGFARTLAALEAGGAADQASDQASGESLPGEEVFEALVQDLASARLARDDGRVAQALNQRLPGSRMLVLSSARAAASGDFAPPWRESVITAFPGWADPAIWEVLRQDGGALTGFYLLTSLDLRLNAEGRPENVPADEAQFRRVLWQTAIISLTVTLLSALLALPVAEAIVSAPGRVSRVLMALVLFPLWTSLLVRSILWIILLQRNGPVNAVLLGLGLTEAPLSLIYTRFSLYLAMVQVLLPLMVLTLVGVLRRIPPQQMQAALSLGASWPRAWLTVQLPQLLPGLLAGCGLVFVFALGYYITPMLVGGPGDQMLSSLIAFYTDETLNWGLAAALSLQMLLLVLAAGAGTAVLLRLRPGPHRPPRPQSQRPAPVPELRS